MARGRRPTPAELKLMAGNPGHRSMNLDEPKPDGVPVMPEWLSERARALWAQHADIAFWLTAADSMKLAVFCGLAAEIQTDLAGIKTSRIALWRSLGSDLGFDPSGRPKLTGGSRKPKTAASRFFD